MTMLIRLAGITISLIVLFMIPALASDTAIPNPIAFGPGFNQYWGILVITCDIHSFDIDRTVSPDPDWEKIEDPFQDVMDEIRLLCVKANFLRSTRVIKIICYRLKSANLGFSCEIDSDALLVIGLRVDLPPWERRGR